MHLLVWAFFILGAAAHDAHTHDVEIVVISGPEGSPPEDNQEFRNLILERGSTRVRKTEPGERTYTKQKKEYDLNHTWGNWKLIGAGRERSGGYYHQTCEVCNTRHIDDTWELHVLVDGNHTVEEYGLEVVFVDICYECGSKLVRDSGAFEGGKKHWDWLMSVRPL